MVWLHSPFFIAQETVRAFRLLPEVRVVDWELKCRIEHRANSEGFSPPTFLASVEAQAAKQDLVFRNVP